VPLGSNKTPSHPTLIFTGQDSQEINELSDGGTDDDLSAFDSAYDSTAVDKMADTDEDFDPVSARQTAPTPPPHFVTLSRPSLLQDKLFSQMEELGESKARNQYKEAHGDDPHAQLPTAHDDSVDGAMGELQQQAHLAEQIAQHPSRFQMGAHGVQGLTQGIPGAGMKPSVAFPGNNKLMAEMRLTAADVKMAHAVPKAVALSAPKKEGAAAPKAKPAPKSSKAQDPTGGKVDKKKKAAKKSPEDKAKAKAKEKQHEAKGKATGDPFAGNASPPLQPKKHVEEKTATAAANSKSATVEPLAAKVSKVKPAPKAKTAPKTAKDKVVSLKKASNTAAAKKPGKPAAKKAGKPAAKKAGKPAAKKAGKPAAKKAGKPAAKKAGKPAAKKAGKPNGAPKSEKDYFMDAARAMQSGVSAKKLLKIARKANSIHNTSKAKAFLAAAEEAEAKELARHKSAKPPENLLDILRRKQGHAKKMNAVALAADNAVSHLGKEITQEDTAKAKLNVNHVKAPTSASAVFTELHAEAAKEQPDEQANVDVFTDDAAKEALDAESHLLAIQTASNMAIAKARARVTAAKARAKKGVQVRAKKLNAKQPDLSQMLDLMSAKLQHNELNKQAEAKAAKTKATIGKAKHGAVTEKKAVKANSFGFAGKKTTPNKNKVAKPTAELGESMHLWINNQPIHTPLKKKAHKTKKAVSPQKEMANKKQANKMADLEHIWINGKPYVSKTATKKETAVVKPAVVVEKQATKKEEVAKKPTELGEEGLEQMRAMRISAKHVGGSSKSIKDQNKILGDAEYAFSIHNTNKAGQPMGLAKKVQLAIHLPKEAKVNDAYFYLEAEGKEDPKSMNCKISHGDGKTHSKVNCMVPQVKDLVDVYVRAHYDGDQNALQKLMVAKVDATLHEGKEVLTTSTVSAVKKLPLLKSMPLPAE